MIVSGLVRMSLVACASAAFALCAVVTVNPKLMSVHTVYLLGMSHGLDQYLTNHLSSLGIFQIVTDPQKADAILTDHVGETFESQLSDLYPKPVDKDAKSGDVSSTSVGQPNSTLGRGRGTIFLVDRKSRTVLWSVYDLPKSDDSKVLDRTANRIAHHLQQAIKSLQKEAATTTTS